MKYDRPLPMERDKTFWVGYMTAECITLGVSEKRITPRQTQEVQSKVSSYSAYTIDLDFLIDFVINLIGVAVAVKPNLHSTGIYATLCFVFDHIS